MTCFKCRFLASNIYRSCAALSEEYKVSKSPFSGYCRGWTSLQCERSSRTRATNTVHLLKIDGHYEATGTMQRTCRFWFLLLDRLHNRPHPQNSLARHQILDGVIAETHGPSPASATLTASRNNSLYIVPSLSLGNGSARSAGVFMSISTCAK